MRPCGREKCVLRTKRIFFAGNKTDKKMVTTKDKKRKKRERDERRDMPCFPFKVGCFVCCCCLLLLLCVVCFCYCFGFVCPATPTQEPTKDYVLLNGMIEKHQVCNTRTGYYSGGLPLSGTAVLTDFLKKHPKNNNKTTRRPF